MEPENSGDPICEPASDVREDLYEVRPSVSCPGWGCRDVPCEQRADDTKQSVEERNAASGRESAGLEERSHEGSSSYSSAMMKAKAQIAKHIPIQVAQPRKECVVMCLEGTPFRRNLCGVNRIAL